MTAHTDQLLDQLIELQHQLDHAHRTISDLQAELDRWRTEALETRQHLNPRT